MKPTTRNVSKSQIELLLRAKEQITWLNLSNKNITNDMLKTIGQLDNLTRLKLNNNPITDLGISYLTNLNHLEILNLYGSSVTEKSIVSLRPERAIINPDEKMDNKFNMNLLNEMMSQYIELGEQTGTRQIVNNTLK